MSQWRPGPSFYPSPAMAMQALPEALVYVSLVNPAPVGGAPDALGVVDLIPPRTPTAPSLDRSTCRMPAKSCIISGGTPAAPASVPTRRIHTWSPGFSSSPACARATHVTHAMGATHAGPATLTATASAPADAVRVSAARTDRDDDRGDGGSHRRLPDRRGVRRLDRVRAARAGTAAAGVDQPGSDLGGRARRHGAARLVVMPNADDKRGWSGAPD